MVGLGFWGARRGRAASDKKGDRWMLAACSAPLLICSVRLYVCLPPHHYSVPSATKLFDNLGVSPTVYEGSFTMLRIVSKRFVRNSGIASRALSSAVTQATVGPPSVMENIVHLNFVDPSGARRKVPSYVGKLVVLLLNY